MSTFSTINTAMSGLQAHQAAINVTGHNVANVNTPGYHRQEAVLQTGTPLPPAGSRDSHVGGQYGAGVEVTSIRRLQNGFLQQQMQRAQGQMGYWSTAQSALQQIEAVMAPGEGLDLSSMMDQFFTAWQELSTQPGDVTRRDSVRSAASNLTNTLNQSATYLDRLTGELDTALTSRVDQLNELSEQLAGLNAQIGMAQGEGRAPNDLLDRRDSVLGEMTTLAGVSSLSTEDGSAIVNLGGRSLVQGSMAHRLQVVSDASGTRVIWEDGASAQFSNGEIAGLREMRDRTAPQYRAQLDTIAFALNSSVNALHRSGITTHDAAAGEFFSGTTAATIRVADAILADHGNIATTRTAGATGDGSLASAIYALNQQPLIGNQTLGQSAQNLVGQIGNAVRNGQTNLDANAALHDHLSTQEQAVSGVSLDEEMANLLIYQRAYDASARVLSIADDMLKTLIERLG